MATMATALLVLLLAAPVILGEKYTVGDKAGWESGVNYTAWTSDKTFTVGDTLEFKYGSNHKVNEVNENSYNSCDTASFLKSHSGTTVTIELSKAGPMYFLCPTLDHCSNGMKLLVNIVESSSGTPPSTPTTGTPPPSGSGSPPTTSGTENPPPPPPSSPSGAWTSVCNMNVITASVALAMFLLAFMG